MEVSHIMVISYLYFELDPEVSKTEGRVGQTTNVVIGGTVADDSTNEWLALDQKVIFFCFSCIFHVYTIVASIRMV